MIETITLSNGTRVDLGRGRFFEFDTIDESVSFYSETEYGEFHVPHAPLRDGLRLTICVHCLSESVLMLWENAQEIVVVDLGDCIEVRSIELDNASLGSPVVVTDSAHGPVVTYDWGVVAMDADLTVRWRRRFEPGGVTLVTARGVEHVSLHNECFVYDTVTGEGVDA